jgi:hypothetical protein
VKESIISWTYHLAKLSSVMDAEDLEVIVAVTLIEQEREQRAPRVRSIS